MSILYVGCLFFFFFFFKQKTAYEMRISDWSSDVCSSDLLLAEPEHDAGLGEDRRIAALDAFEQPQRGVVARAGANRRIEPRHGFEVVVIDVGPRIDDRRDRAFGLVAEIRRQDLDRRQIGRAHVRTPVTNAQLVCRLLLEKKKK